MCTTAKPNREERIRKKAEELRTDHPEWEQDACWLTAEEILSEKDTEIWVARGVIRALKAFGYHDTFPSTRLDMSPGDREKLYLLMDAELGTTRRLKYVYPRTVGDLIAQLTGVFMVFPPAGRMSGL